MRKAADLLSGFCDRDSGFVPPARRAEKLVTVTGQATISVAPDTAMIRIGVTSHGKSAKEASDANAKRMTAVMAAIKDSGIAERDIQTSRLSLQPQYEHKGGTASLLGFQVTNQLTSASTTSHNYPPSSTGP